MRGFRAIWIPFVSMMAACECDCRECPAPLPSTCITTRPEPANDEVDPACRDDYEPNADLPRAAAPRAGQECAGGEKRGVIAGDNDVDVYRTGICSVGTVARAMTPWVYLDTDDPLRACLFPMCAEGSTNVYKEEDGCYENTPGDGQPVDADGKPLPPIVWKVRTESGFRGCCRVGRGRVTAKFDCAHFSTKFDAYYWVDGGDETLGANACPTYTLSYGPQ